MNPASLICRLAGFIISHCKGLVKTTGHLGLWNSADTELGWKAARVCFGTHSGEQISAWD